MKIAKNPYPHQGSVQGWRSKKDNPLRVIYMTTTTTNDTVTVANASTTIAVASVLLPKPEKNKESFMLFLFHQPHLRLARLL